MVMRPPLRCHTTFWPNVCNSTKESEDVRRGSLSHRSSSKPHSICLCCDVRLACSIFPPPSRAPPLASNDVGRRRVQRPWFTHAPTSNRKLLPGRKLQSSGYLWGGNTHCATLSFAIASTEFVTWSPIQIALDWAGEGQRLNIARCGLKTGHRLKRVRSPDSATRPCSFLLRDHPLMRLLPLV